MFSFLLDRPARRGILEETSSECSDKDLLFFNCYYSTFNYFNGSLGTGLTSKAE